jgi:hypothetical protein
MRELKLFVLRLVAAAFIITFCMTVSRSPDTGTQSSPTQSSAAASLPNPHSNVTDGSTALAPAGQNATNSIARLKLVPAVPDNR